MKTDNSYLKYKALLRLETINLIPKKSIKVLECYSGEGIIWKEVKMASKKQISILQIEKQKGKNKFAIYGDNIKVMKSIDLNAFDIIDLDAYGIPYEQLKIIFQNKYKGIVHVTAIQSGMGKLPNGLIKELGYSEKMIKNIPTLFNRNGLDKLKNYLYLHGVKYIEGYFIDKKNYFYFKT